MLGYLRPLFVIAIFLFAGEVHSIECTGGPNDPPACSSMAAWGSAQNGEIETEDVVDPTAGLSYENDPTPDSTQQNGDGSGAAASAGSSDGGTDQCEEAKRRANKICNGGTWSNMALPIIQAFLQSNSSGDMAGACKSAKNFNAISGAVNGGFAAFCAAKINQCQNTCSEMAGIASDNANTARTNKNIAIQKNQNWVHFDEEERRYRREARGHSADARSCEAQMYKVQLAAVQTQQNLLNYAQSEQCERIASGIDNPCEGPHADLYPQCVDCSDPANAQKPICLSADVDPDICNDPNEAPNHAICVCRNNPNLPECGGGENLIGDTGVPEIGDDDISLDPDPYLGGEGGLQPIDVPESSGALASSGGSGGAAGLGGGGYGGQVGQTEGGGPPGEGPHDTDILKGTSGGNAAPAAGGGGGYAASNRGGKRGSARSGKDSFKGFDLKKFMPKKKGKKGSRTIAGKIGGGEISCATCGTLFQKVSQKYSQKKHQMMK